MSVSKAVRARSGTVTDPATGQRTKFPEPDRRHAVLAVAFERRAKPPLTPRQRHTVEARAATFGVGPLATKAPRSAAKR